MIVRSIETPTQQRSARFVKSARASAWLRMITHSWATALVSLCVQVDKSKYGRGPHSSRHATLRIADGKFAET